MSGKKRNSEDDFLQFVSKSVNSGEGPAGNRALSSVLGVAEDLSCSLPGDLRVAEDLQDAFGAA